MAHFERAKPHYVECLKDLLELLSPGAHSVEDPDQVITGFEVDSRKITPGKVFVAAPGARLDGHDFLLQAIQNGASACLISKIPQGGELPPNCILVKDALVALGYLAAAHRRSLKVKVIAITGSVGKTTTKEMLFNILAPHFYAKKSEGNFNSTIGLPIQLLRLKKTDEIMVAEMGMSFPGEIRSLMRMAMPDIGIWTTVKNAHLVNFESLEDIARAKAEMVEELGNDKTLVFNADDPLVSKYAAGFSGRKISYGFMSPVADVTGQIAAFSDWRGTDFTVDYADGTQGRSHLPIPGKFNIHNALVCCAVAWFLGLKHAEFVASFRRELSVKGRSNLQTFSEDIQLVDDCYNSSPYAMAQVIRSFSSLAESTYRWIIVGDMLEQGRNEIGIHRVLGHELAHNSFDRVTFVGDLVRHAYEIFVKYTDNRVKVEHFANADVAEHVAQSEIPSNSRIWIKGSRSIGLERVAQAFMTHLQTKENEMLGL